jgi:nucleoside-diphosphate-sugar epimerase
MVVGSGLIAREFCDYYPGDDVIIFASGVSNSLEDKASEFNREKDLLLKYLDNYHKSLFIYFSTTDILNREKENSLYVLHKKEIENIIIRKSKKYLIFRLSQVVGLGGNSNTIINYLYNSIKLDKDVKIYKNATRNLIDINYIVGIVNYIIKKEKAYNKVINIAAPKNISVERIVITLEEILGKKAKKHFVDIGNDMFIDIVDIVDIMDTHAYNEEVIRKYFKREGV